MHCSFCGKGFLPTRPWSKYCSNECRITANNRSEKHRAAARIYNPSVGRANKKRYRDKVKLEVLAHYGGTPPRCQCPGNCDASDIEFLTIDHLEGHGRAHRNAIGHQGTEFYVWLRHGGYPSGYRVLCMNCNLAFGNHGYCPHEKHKIAQFQVEPGSLAS